MFKRDKDGVPILSPSQINLLLQCGAKWRYKYVDKMKDKMGIDAKIGNFTHEALEIVAKSTMDGQEMSPDDAHRIAYESSINYFCDPEQLSELRAEDAATAIQNSDKYANMCADLAKTAWRWFRDNEFKVVEVEKSVEMVTEFKGNKVKVGGRLDILALDRDGDLLICDWKSAPKAPSRSIKGGYVMDRAHVIQQLIYAKCLIGLGMNVKRVGTLKITKTKVPAAYFAYVDVTPGMLSFCEGIIQSAIQMVYSDILPPNPIGAGFLCSQKYCFAWDVCPGSSRHIEPAAQEE